MDSEAGLGRAPPPAPGSQSSSDMFGGQRPLCLRELSGQAAHMRDGSSTQGKRPPARMPRAWRGHVLTYKLGYREQLLPPHNESAVHRACSPAPPRSEGAQHFVFS